MAQEKDMTQKELFSYKDVFADIINVFLFNGKKQVTENDLESYEVNSSTYVNLTNPGDSSTEMERQLKGQVRDISMYVKNKSIGVNLVLMGIENQTTVDKDMPLRIISYDGASYRREIDEGDVRYPVFTIVLYFGKKPWDQPTSLYEMFNITGELKKYINDYKIHVFSIKDLSSYKLKQFTSDLKNYFEFVNTKLNDKEFHPKYDKDPLKHPGALCKAIDFFDGDNNMYSYYNDIRKDKGGTVTMSDFFEQSEKRGEKRGEDKKLVEIIINMLKNNFTDEQIQNATKTSIELIKEIKKTL